MAIGEGITLLEWFDLAVEAHRQDEKKAEEDGVHLVPLFIAIHPREWDAMRTDPFVMRELKVFKGTSKYTPVVGELVATYRDVLEIYVTI